MNLGRRAEVGPLSPTLSSKGGEGAKPQTPSPREAQNIKHQNARAAFFAANLQLSTFLTVWSLVLEVSLALGAWSFCPVVQ